MPIIQNPVYKSQLDNENNPTGSCNVTSITMGFCTGGIPTSTNNRQTEDLLYEYLTDQGYSRYAPYDLARGSNEFRQAYYPNHNVWVELDVNASWSKVKAHLNRNRPVIVHGYFTTFGHIVCIVGYDEQGNWIVNDPYGEWNSWGYDCNASGKQQVYSHNLMNETCGPDGTLWAHFIDWETPQPNPYLSIPNDYRGQAGGLKLQEIYVQNLTLEISEIKTYRNLTWQIQVRLTSLGIDVGKTDSTWGQNTEAGFKLFCQKVKAKELALNKAIAKQLIELKSL